MEIGVIASLPTSRIASTMKSVLYEGLIQPESGQKVMWIRRLEIENFRSIKEEAVNFEENITTFIGPNGSGKTTVIDAIQVLFGDKKIQINDFNDKTKEIKFRAEFGGKQDELKVNLNSKNQYSIIFQNDNGMVIDHKRSEFIRGGAPTVIESMRNPSDDAHEGRESALKKLISSAISKSGISSTETLELKTKIKDLYNEYAMKAYAGLEDLSTGITEKIKKIDEGIEIELKADQDALNKILVPRAEAFATIRNHTSNIDKIGSGDQRLYMYGILQHLHEQNLNSSGNERSMLIIDEPELHQHPIRQEGLYSILHELTGDYQIILATHSEKFVFKKELKNLRFFRNNNGTKISTIDLEEIIDACKEKYIETDLTMINRHLVRMDQLDFRDSLFSGIVLLVEGITDKMIIREVAIRMKKNLAKYGISVVSCNGKQNICEQIFIYDKLGIKRYVIWDFDKHSNPPDSEMETLNMKSNKTILACIDVLPQEIQHDTINKDYLCFEEKIDKLFGIEDQEKIREYKKEYQLEYGVPEIVNDIYDKGQKIEIIEELVEYVISMATPPTKSK